MDSAARAAWGGFPWGLSLSAVSKQASKIEIERCRFSEWGTRQCDQGAQGSLGVCVACPHGGVHPIRVFTPSDRAQPPTNNMLEGVRLERGVWGLPTPQPRSKAKQRDAAMGGGAGQWPEGRDNRPLRPAERKRCAAGPGGLTRAFDPAEEESSA